VLPRFVQALEALLVDVIDVSKIGSVALQHHCRAGATSERVEKTSQKLSVHFAVAASVVGRMSVRSNGAPALDVIAP
jgi:hypothetical protein